MKNINQIRVDLWHVISEPGDATRYCYFIYKASNHFYHFMPSDNSFRYPQRLSYNEVKNINSIDDSKCQEIATDENCNLYTLIECIRTIKELKKR